MHLISHGRHVLKYKPFHIGRRLQHGYIVLIPEIGEEAPETNPLYRNDGLPEFNDITIEHCRAAIAKQTLEFESGIKDIEKEINENTVNNIFREVFEPLEKIGASLDLTWGVSKTLYLGNSTKMPTASYMSIHERASWARASKYTTKGIYETVKLAIENKVGKTSEENRILQKFSVEGRLNGLELTKDQNEILARYTNIINNEKINLKRKLEIGTQQFAHTISSNVITREFPEYLLKATSLNPNNYLQGPWKVSLQPHIYLPVMQYCSDREIRWNMWQALVSRGSNRNRELATSLNVEEIRFSRREIAKLLGYQTFADMSMETKMAGKIEEVQNMIHSLLKHARPAQEQELSSLHDFAAERGFHFDELELWDVPYWRRKQAQSLFNYTEDDFKDCFPLSSVLSGMFQLCERLFGIQIKQKTDVSTWHKDVQFYDVFDRHQSAPIAGFYLDPYSRQQEKVKVYNNSWMVAIQNRSEITESRPLCALIFNFDPISESKTTHLTFKEVKNLFHKFGYAMQHLLTRTRFSEVAGVSNIEWDTVEVSGNVMCHWLLTKSVITSISCKPNTNESLPEDMIEALLNMETHMAGLDLCKELYLSMLDLEIHSTKKFWLDIMKRLWPEYRCFKLNKEDIHPCSFTPIFVEEWGAAYYSHVWARMIAADIFSAFHEVRDDEQQITSIGKRYRDTFLSLGGGAHPGQVFREFRGRDPSPKALLKSLGLKKVQAEQ